MHSSFISEHSAELILVPAMIKILLKKYKKVTPIYYWSTREGGLMSRQSFQSKNLKLLAMYPRRPKVIFAGSGAVQIKLNQVLFTRSNYLHSNGITVIGGAPLADSLDSFHSETPCIWFYIKPDGAEEIFEFDLLSQAISSNTINLLSPEMVINLVEKYSESLSWPGALHKIKEMTRSSDTSYHHWNWMSGDLYKPVYLLMHSDREN